MEKRIILNNQPTPFWIETTGRVRNEKTHNILKGGVNKGYHLYNLFFKGKQYTLYTHRLVAEYFIPNPENHPIVHHKDGNRLNNNVDNLQWISTKEHQKTMTATPRTTVPIKYTSTENEKLKQFRNSPYYASKDGRIINKEQGIVLTPEKAGNYFRFSGRYNLGNKHFLIHRVVWECFNGEIPEGMEIDHIDGDPSNNALDNLQLLSHSQNCTKARHNNIAVIAVDIYDENNKIEFSSLNQALIFLFGDRRGVNPIKNAIKNGTEYYGYKWYYKE